MGKAVKIAISLPPELLKAAERERKARKQTRSELFRNALESFLRSEHERRASERYVRGYRDMPETEEEIQAVHQAGIAALARESWE